MHFRAESTPCPICQTSSPLHDVVDFNKSCEDLRRERLTPSGKAIYYNLCPECGFCFCPEIASWSTRKFKLKIYNSEYISHDPDYLEHRPLNYATMLEQLFGENRNAIKHLDYGGGNGKLSATLQKKGFTSTSYDPFVDGNNLPSDRYNLISAIEVFEHVPDPHELMQRLDSLICEESLLLISTLLSDEQIERNKRLDWWYASPRNGHISLFSQRSLETLLNIYGYQLCSLNACVHFACKSIPEWASTYLGEE